MWWNVMWDCLIECMSFDCISFLHCLGSLAGIINWTLTDGLPKNHGFLLFTASGVTFCQDLAHQAQVKLTEIHLRRGSSAEASFLGCHGFQGECEAGLGSHKSWVKEWMGGRIIEVKWCEISSNNGDNLMMLDEFSLGSLKWVLVGRPTSSLGEGFRDAMFLLVVETETWQTYINQWTKRCRVELAYPNMC